MNKDIVNIVRRLVFYEAIKECNREYYKMFVYRCGENAFITFHNYVRDKGSKWLVIRYMN